MQALKEEYDEEEQIEFIKQVILEKGLVIEVLEYFNIINYYSDFLKLQDISTIRLLEIKRSELHTNILQKLGCLTPTNRKYCPSCPSHKFCLKQSLAIYFESKHRKVSII